MQKGVNMKIINGQRVYAKELKKLVKIDNDGWDRYDGQNYQWYSLYAAELNDGSILYRLNANNSGSCYGEYSDKYFIGAGNLKKYVADKFCYDDSKQKIGELLGEIDEDNELVLKVLEDLGL